MELDDEGLLDVAADSQASQVSSTSQSSLTVQFSAEDLQENNNHLDVQTMETVLSEGKTRRLNRRLALANLQTPKLIQKSDAVIDLRADEDGVDNFAWLKKKFPLLKADFTKTDTTSTSVANTALPSVTTQRSLKQLLEKKLAERRMVGLAKRKELYMKDNEGIIDDEEKQKERGVKRRYESKRLFKEYQMVGEGSEDDDNYSGDDEDEDEEKKSAAESLGGEKNELEEEASGSTDDVSEVVDASDAKNSASSTVKDGVEPTMQEDKISESSDCMTQPVFPNSLSQWFGDRTTDEDDEAVQSVVDTHEFVNIGTFSDMDPFRESNEDDILMFCSGRFDTDDLVQPSSDLFKNDAQLSDSQNKSSKITRKRKRLSVESDEEDHSDSMALSNGFRDQRGSDEVKSDSDLLNTEPEVTTYTLRRTLVDSDSEISNHSNEAEGYSYQEEEEDNENENEKANTYVDDEADSDDELAVVRKLEKNDLGRRVNREKWFDDEASLSGDDMGSDLDEDLDVPDEYEAEEGDADDVPDSHIIRRQNQKLLMKQENDRDHQELVKLQNRLLADGDLGSIETNRTFRLKLRENISEEGIIEEEAELPTNEKDDCSSQASARRVSAIKWLMEHASFFSKEEYQKTCDHEEENDLFDIAAQSVHIATNVSTPIMSKTPRSLLGKASLENAIKEIPGSTGVKQLYVNSSVPQVQKRPSPTLQLSKKQRNSLSVLSILE